MSSYATVAGGFAAAHGIFLLVLLGLLLPRYAEADAAVDTAALRGAVGAVALVLALGFTLDLVGLRERPFAWIRSLAEASMGRVLVVQMTILIGMPVMAYFGTPRSFLAVFVGLKVLVDLGSLIPRYEPQEAPRWLVRAMRPFGRGRRGDFAAYWRQRKAEERRRFADDEVTAAE